MFLLLSFCFVFFFNIETISTTFHLQHQRIDSVNGSWVLNELNALKPKIIKNEYLSKTFENLTCIYDLQHFS